VTRSQYEVFYGETVASITAWLDGQTSRSKTKPVSRAAESPISKELVVYRVDSSQPIVNI